MKTPYKRSGEYLKTLRKEAKLTQKQLAKKLKFGTPQFVSNVERGIFYYSPKKLKLLFKVLNRNGLKLHYLDVFLFPDMEAEFKNKQNNYMVKSR